MDNSLMGLSALHHGSEMKTAKLGFKWRPNMAPVYTAAVERRNERERNRVRVVNNGFVVLRQRIPFAKANKKMSKVETLRSAIDYISQLQQLLSTDEESLFGGVASSASLAPTSERLSSPAVSPPLAPSGANVTAMRSNSITASLDGAQSRPELAFRVDFAQSSSHSRTGSSLSSYSVDTSYATSPGAASTVAATASTVAATASTVAATASTVAAAATAATSTAHIYQQSPVDQQLWYDGFQL